MSFIPKKQTFGSAIRTVTLGTGDRALVIGGQNVLPFYTFDAPVEHPPVIGLELSDRSSTWTAPGLQRFYEGCTTLARMAQRAETLEGIGFLALHFESADPNGGNRSVEDCVADAVAVAQVTSLPIAVLGCKNQEKDELLFAAVAKALAGRNILILSAKAETYQSVGAACLENGHTLCAETADDVNLAKQLNIMLQGMKVPAGSICMNIGTAAVGYGYEYVASTMDRVRLAALEQDDADLQMPIVAPVSPDAWSVKEALATEQEEPAWGDPEERGIQMEIATAAADLLGGADAVILRHPAAVKTIFQFIQDLI